MTLRIHSLVRLEAGRSSMSSTSARPTGTRCLTLCPSGLPARHQEASGTVWLRRLRLMVSLTSMATRLMVPPVKR
jgi:hypothetical protein